MISVKKLEWLSMGWDERARVLACFLDRSFQFSRPHSTCRCGCKIDSTCPARTTTCRSRRSSASQGNLRRSTSSTSGKRGGGRVERTARPYHRHTVSCARQPRSAASRSPRSGSATNGQGLCSGGKVSSPTLLLRGRAKAKYQQ